MRDQNRTGESKPLSGQELDRLEAFLDADNPFGWDPMPLDMLQGFLCGVASAPEAIGPDSWLPWALGIEQWPDTRPGASDWYDLVIRYQLQQVPSLEGREDAALVFYEETPGVSNRFEHWCIGFLDGLGLAEVSIDQLGDPEELDELLFPIEVLGDALEEHDRAKFNEAEWAALLADCEAELWPAVLDTYKYGNALRGRPVTMKRSAPKTGRNEPCHCGSGKKYKNCHGKGH